MTVASLAGLYLTKFSTETTRSIRIKGNITSLLNLITERVRYNDLCTQTLGLSGDVPFKMNLSDINNSSQELNLSIPDLKAGGNMNSNDLSVGTKIIPLGLEVRSMRMTNPALIGPVRPDGSYSVITILKMGMNQLSNSSGGSLSYSDVVIGPLYLDISASDKITSCRMDQTVSLRDVCLKFGCSYEASGTPPCRCPPQSSVFCKPNQLPVGSLNGEIKCVAYGGICGVNSSGVQQVMTGGGLELIECGDPPQWAPPIKVLNPGN